MVVDGTDILQRGAETGDVGDGHVLQQVPGVAVEPLDATAEAVVEEAELEGHVGRVAGLPGEVGVGRVDQAATRAFHILIAVAGKRTPAVVAARQRTVDTVGSAETEIAQDILVLEERLVADAPGTGHRPEVTPAGSGTQTGAAVPAEAGRHVVLVVVVVFGAGENRHHRVAPIVGVRIERTGGRHRVEGAHRKVFTRRTHELGVVLLGLEADQGAHVALAKFLVEVERGGRDRLLVARHHFRHLAVDRGAVVVLGAVPDVVADARVVIGEYGAEVQPVGELDGGRLAHGDFEGAGVVLPQVVVVQLVLGKGSVAGRPGIARLVVIRPVERPQQVAGLHEVVGARVAGIVVTFLVGVGQAHVGGQFEEFAHLLVEVHAAADTVEAVDVNASLVFRI